MSPLILLFGGALFLASRKKHRPKSAGSQEPPQAPGSGHDGHGGQPGGGGLSGSGTIAARPLVHWKVWEKCDPPIGSSKGTYAAYGIDGKCMVFWRPETWETMYQFLQQEFSKLSTKQKNKICNPDECIPNPYATDAQLFCEWLPNPFREDFLIRTIQLAYPQLGPESLPAKDEDPFFPRMVWTFTSNLFSSEFCNIGKVT